VFPFGLAGGPDGVAAGPPDDFGQIRRLLRILQGDGAELLVRAYVAWFGADTTDTALGQIADLTGTGLRWDLPLAGMEGSTPIRVRENGCPPGQIAPNAGKQTYSTLCCAPSTPAATNSTSPTGSCSPSATPTAHAPTPSTSSVSCATTTAQTGVRATAPDLRRAPMRRTFLSRLRALRMDGQRSAPNTTSGRVPHGIVLAADGAAAPGTKGPSVL